MKYLQYMIVVLLSAFFVFAGSTYCKGKKDSVKKLDAKTIQNFINGINSENPGLCKCCIYYAGYYKIEETVESLINVLNNYSNENSLRTLAAVSLYRIGNIKGIRAIRDIAQFGLADNLRSVCKCIYNEYLRQAEILCWINN